MFLFRIKLGFNSHECMCILHTVYNECLKKKEDENAPQFLCSIYFYNKKKIIIIYVVLWSNIVRIGCIEHLAYGRQYLSYTECFGFIEWMTSACIHNPAQILTFALFNIRFFAELISSITIPIRENRCLKMCESYIVSYMHSGIIFLLLFNIFVLCILVFWDLVFALLFSTHFGRSACSSVCLWNWT